MVMPVGRSLVFELQLSQTLRPILKRFAGRLARYANIDILKTSSAEEENILGNVALSPPARGHSCDHQAMPLIETLYVVETLYAIWILATPFPRGKLGVSLRAV